GSYPRGEMSAALVSRVAEEAPGVLVEQAVVIPPGGNRVRSYLDVVAPDGTDPSSLRAALDVFERGLPVDALPLVRIVGGAIGVRLNADIGWWSTMTEEYRALRDAVLRVLEACEESGRDPAVPRGGEQGVAQAGKR